MAIWNRSAARIYDAQVIYGAVSVPRRPEPRFGPGAGLNWNATTAAPETAIVVVVVSRPNPRGPDHEERIY